LKIKQLAQNKPLFYVLQGTIFRAKMAKVEKNRKNKPWKNQRQKIKH
jgi:hypothetical protein